jgi:hypothetical protein
MCLHEINHHLCQSFINVPIFPLGVGSIRPIDILFGHKETGPLACPNLFIDNINYLAWPDSTPRTVGPGLKLEGHDI